jgi:hypothetical protein
LLRPFQKTVALLVLLVFLFNVFLEGRLVAEIHDLDRMVDDEIDRHQRVDPLRIAAEMLHRIAHGGEIDDGGNTGKILHQHPRWPECDLAIRGLGLEPLREAENIVLGDGTAVFIAQQIFEQNLHRERQTGNTLEAGFLRDRKAVIDIRLRAHFEGTGALEAVEGCHGAFPFRQHQGGRFSCGLRAVADCLSGAVM